MQLVNLLWTLVCMLPQCIICQDYHDYYPLPAKRQQSDRCAIKNRHYGSWSRWATKGNSTSRHLSLLAPNLPEISLRTVDLQQLHDSPLLAGDHHCPTHLHHHQHNDPIMVRSVCPWYWRINYDPLRYLHPLYLAYGIALSQSLMVCRIPAALPEAHCRCERAVTGNRLFSCQPLTMKIKVGRFDSNCDQFIDDIIHLSVACVSVLQPKLIIEPLKFTGVEKTLILSADTEI